MLQKVEITNISDHEFMIGRNKITILENSTIYIEAVGEQTDEIADVTRVFFLEIYGRLDKKINNLVNLNKAGKNSPKARKLWIEINEHKLTNKVAVFGMHPVAKVIASFIMRVTKKREIRFFLTKEEAEKWLNE